MKAGLAGYKLPLETIAGWLAPFKSIKPIAKEEICKELVEAGKIMFFQRVESLEEKDIKDITKETIKGSMDLVKGVLRLAYSEEDSAKIVQGHEMLLSLRFIQSSSLEKRLNGLADIKKLIDRIEHSQRFMYQPILKDTWFTGDYLAKWILEQKVMEAILNENAHSELVRRSVHILIFLAKKKMLNTSMLELLWKCQHDKHEDIIRGVYDTIKELIDYLTLDDVKYIFGKVKIIPIEKYDEKLLTFMKEFTLKPLLSTQRKSDSRKWKISSLSKKILFLKTQQQQQQSSQNLSFRLIVLQMAPLLFRLQNHFSASQFSGLSYKMIVRFLLN
jgi:hypothetical protein